MSKRLAKRKLPREPYEPPIPLKRISELRRELESPEALSKDLRAEIAAALSCLGLIFALEKRAHRRGRRVNIYMVFAAYVVDQLMRNHGAKRVKTAAFAALPRNSKQKLVDTLERTYRKLKATDGFRGIGVSQGRIDEAAARLRSGNK